jgi:carbonic anhydrase
VKRIKSIIQGLCGFREELLPKYQELFELSPRQRLKVLLISCSDSRTDPSLLTRTQPGDLFIIRNAGNIVPTFGQSLGGVTATIEYAVMALGVRDIIVCGHSNCGAMGAVLHPERVVNMKNVASWIQYGEPARIAVEQQYGHLSGDELLIALTKRNVLAQLNNLRTHPAVTAGLAKGDLRLHGWVYEIETGKITAFDPSKKCFMPLRHIAAAGVGNQTADLFEEELNDELNIDARRSSCRNYSY